MNPMKILLPVDGSPESLEAVRHAVQLARHGLRVGFVLVNVQSRPSVYEMMTVRDDAARRRASGQAGEHLLEPAARLLRSAGLAYHEEVVVGEPHRALIDLVERHRCDAVLIGASRVGAMRGFLAGSTSMALLHDAPVPVTVVHLADGDAADGGGDESDADAGDAGGDGGGGDGGGGGD